MKIFRYTAGSALVLSLVLSGCSSAGNFTEVPSSESALTAAPAVSVSSPEITGKMNLLYAEQFSVSYRSDGCAEITSGPEKFLFVPENTETPADNTLPVLHEAHEKIYLAASSAMDLFFSMNAESCIEFTSTSAGNWSRESIKKAVEDEDIFYVGKYSAPDYEFLLSEGCTAAIESTMINHSPAVKEKLISLGIPVFTEMSSYESHPLGRLEWIKLYGLLTGKQDEAEAFFEEKLKTFEDVQKNTASVTDRKTVAFFYITSSGYVNVRKPGDYISKMIELAGGEYIFTNQELGTGEDEMSSVNMQMEEFYNKAKDADYIIYNSSIEAAPADIEQLTGKSSLFSDFRAVKNGNVYCSGHNMFQQTGECSDMIRELSIMLSGNPDDSLVFLDRLS